MKPFGLREDLRQHTLQYYREYCNMLRDRGITPVPYHVFSGYNHKGFSIKKTYEVLHK